MSLIKLVRARRLLPLAALAMVFAAAGCGEKTDVSEGVKNINEQVLSPQGASLECPKEVDGGEGTEFDCTLKGTKGGKESPVKMKVTKEGDDLAVDIADEKQFQTALQEVTG